MAKTPGNKVKNNESKFLENLIEFLSDPEGLTDKETNEYFSEESNLDIDALTKNFTREIQVILARRTRELMQMKADENRQIFDERRKQLSPEDDLHFDKEGLIERLMAIMKTPRLEIAVHHRNLSSMSYDDLLKIYNELRILEDDATDEHDDAAS